MKRIAVWIAYTGLLAALLVALSDLAGHLSGAPERGYAQGNDPNAGCTNSTLMGDYGDQRNGHTSTGELTTVGIVKFDGQGNAVIHETISKNGVFSTVDKLGGYAINSDCTGTLLDLSGNVVGQLVLVHNGAEVLSLSMSPGNNVAAHFERVVDPPGNAPAGSSSRP